MGGENSKLNYRKSVIQLTTKTEPVDPKDEEFWDQFWNEYETTVQDIFILMPAAEIRALREECPTNLSTLCTKAVQKVALLSRSSCLTIKEQNTVLNCVRMLTRITPYLFEDTEWANFFWTTTAKMPSSCQDEDNPTEDNEEDDAEPLPEMSLAEMLMTSVADLLFFPDFTVFPLKKTGPDQPEDSGLINSCEYIWENGVGFSNSQGSNSAQDSNRGELLKLLLTLSSVTMYETRTGAANRWIGHFTSRHNRHALPLFTSLLNVVCSYDPVGYGMPYNHLMFSDHREPLVEVALQVLCVTLETQSDEPESSGHKHGSPNHYSIASQSSVDSADFEGPSNLFVNFMSRIHKDNDLDFMLTGLCRLLNNPLTSTYLPHSMKRIQCHQELLILLWRICGINRNFMFHLLKGDQLMDVLVPILYHLNNSCQDLARLGVMHIGAFILLLLSGERNFGVKLNKSYSNRVHIDVPVFTGNHADLLILVFHRIITTGHSALQPLYDCFLTVIVNISPYLKSLSTSAASKLMHLVEAFSTPWFLYSSPANHHLIFFLLESLNNIVQYQFDGNSNLVYCLIRKRQVFHNLSGLGTDRDSISQALSKRSRRVARLTVLQPTSGVSASSGVGTHSSLTAAVGSISTSAVVHGALQHHHRHNSRSSTTTASPQTPPGSPKSLSSQRSLESSVVTSEPDASTALSGTLKTTLEQTPALRFTIDEAAAAAAAATGSPNPSQQIVGNESTAVAEEWTPTPDWAHTWKQKLPLQTIMRLLQVLVPQVEKICIDKGLTDESEIIRFLQRGTLVGLLPVPHPLLIRKYQSNPGTDKWFRTYMWGVIYLRNEDPPVWYDTNIQLFEVQRVGSG